MSDKDPFDIIEEQAAEIDWGALNRANRERADRISDDLEEGDTNT